MQDAWSVMRAPQSELFKIKEMERLKEGKNEGDN